MVVDNIKIIIKIHILAGKANPSPPVGPILGQHGVNILDFCKKFNDQTKIYEIGTPIPVSITVFKNKTFLFSLKRPTVTSLLKFKINLKKGSKQPLKEIIGTLTMDDVKEIAQTKHFDLTAASEEAAIKTIIGSAQSMGLKILR